ncbi:acyl transferase [Caballeronia udeis]|uniref:[acyl-carrier-protein] S-malonyltransferase n=2 Tax=Caballeronia udeis TaxID=1232866 RepID=A0A158GL69_9BURK|nr:ACP S-malonyltransferase [Caballeronia udeis]SAL32854.1 acyl transferase [Caballeronia udeis]
MKAFIFPGQGSQSKGMGEQLFDRFKDLTGKADEVLGYSVKELCLEDPRDELNNTRFTQPALYVVNALSYFRKVEDTGETPDFLAGHSLGEFNALMAAGCFDFETGLKLVKKRGELMGEVSNGAMAAILNASKEEIDRILSENGLTSVSVANYNTPSQLVISGLVEEITRAEPLFQHGTMRYYPLNTSGAFHSRFMEPAQETFAAFLASFEFATPKIPVISNFSARPYEGGQVIECLSKQITSTVRWCESIQYLLALAAERGNEIEFEELGNGDVLTRLVYTIKLQTPPARAAEVEPQKSTQADTTADAAGDKTAPAGRTSAAEKVAAWNQCHRIGVKVKSSLADYPDLETRTEAVVLFGHRAAVYMKGYNGYFDLDEVVAA